MDTFLQIVKRLDSDLFFLYLPFTFDELASMNNVELTNMNNVELTNMNNVKLTNMSTLKSSLSYLKEHLNNRVSYLSVFDSLASFLRYFSF